MKFLVILATLTLSSALQAKMICPNISATYKCTNDIGGVSTMTISQSKASGGFDTLDVDGDMFIIGGNKQPVTLSELTGFPFVATSECSDTGFLSTFWPEIDPAAEPLEKYQFEIKITQTGITYGFAIKKQGSEEFVPDSEPLNCVVTK